MKRTVINAISVSNSVSDRLNGAVLQGVVLHHHTRTCTLALKPEANPEALSPIVVTLADASVEDGPLNILLDAFNLIRERNIAAGASVIYKEDRLELPGVIVSIAGAARWNPAPDWQKARAATGYALDLRTEILRQANSRVSHATLLDFLSPSRPSAGAAETDALTMRFTSVFQQLRQISATSLKDTLAAGADKLAGLGGGLTPAGDDFLCGVMMAVWFSHDDAAKLCKPPAEIMAQRTTTLSAALLREAAMGHCSMSWRRFIASLILRDRALIESAVTGVLSHGATSGADSLAGFLWMLERMEPVSRVSS
ncbi:DUF2877 domain-containing protein [Hyphococcus sp.]|uniref:DUF2877 domain-containing protein n=1 Tax=Hyphococcus sp. TaxID=2038636 RepID=UPI003CCC1A1E